MTISSSPKVQFMLKFIRTRLLKQYNIGHSVGGLKDLALRTMVYVTAINFVLLVITAYSQALRNWMAHYISWFSFPIFLGVLIALILFAMIIEYKFILPSTWSFINRQQYEHQNPIREDLSKILKGQEKDRKIQEEILGRLKALEGKQDGNNN